MSTEETTNNNQIGATITYDSPWALKAAQDYKNQIAGQLKHKLKNRPHSAAELRRDSIGTSLTDEVLGKLSLPKNYAASLPSDRSPYTPSFGGIQTDPYLKKSGANYRGWHRTSPVNMSDALDDDAWVRGAYQSLLGRDADDAGLAHWKADLAGGSTRDDVISNIKKGSEYKDKFINEAYKNLLGRDVGLEGIDYWSKQMLGGQSEDSVIENIKRSEEFGRRQQNMMRDQISPKTATQLANETYDDKIATLAQDWQTANDEVQKEAGVGPNYDPLLTTADSIYTQDPEASSLSAVNYLATVDDPDPNIWTKALGDAGGKALAGIDISALVDGFINKFV